MVEVEAEVEVEVAADPTVVTVVEVASGEEEQATRIRHATARDRTAAMVPLLPLTVANGRVACCLNRQVEGAQRDRRER